MKLSFFKRRTTRRPVQLSTGGRRVTGLSQEWPKGVRLLLGVFGFFAVLGAIAGTGWYVFDAYYFRSKSLFVIQDLSRDVTITTGKTLTPDLICEVLGIHEGTNLFSIAIEEKQKELQDQAPNIRDISIERRMPNKLSIMIIEREPIGRVGPSGQVVDEEGVVFVRYAGTGGLPQIKGSDALAQIKPGDRLRDMNMAAVRLIYNALRPECRARLLVVDTASDDYLFVTFSDHRQAKIAWEGMQDGEKHTERRMQQQFDQLVQAMDSEIGRPCQVWDATHPGRIFATPPGPAIE